MSWTLCTRFTEASCRPNNVPSAIACYAFKDNNPTTVKTDHDVFAGVFAIPALTPLKSTIVFPSEHSHPTSR